MILIIGAGGHAKVVADILQLQNIPVLGYLDDNPARWGTQVLGKPILASLDRYHEFDVEGMVIAVGDNHARKKIADQLKAHWANAIHPRATVAPSAQLGKGVVIAAHAVVNPDAQIGDHVIINTGATVDHDCIIGDYAHIAPGVHLAGRVTVHAGALVGVGTAIIPQRIIGAWSVVGAGSVVIRDVPDNATVKGVPAR